MGVRHWVRHVSHEHRPRKNIASICFREDKFDVKTMENAFIFQDDERKLKLPSLALTFWILCFPWNLKAHSYKHMER